MNVFLGWLWSQKGSELAFQQSIDGAGSFLPRGGPVLHGGEARGLYTYTRGNDREVVTLRDSAPYGALEVQTPKANAGLGMVRGGSTVAGIIAKSSSVRIKSRLPKRTWEPGAKMT